MNHHIFLVVTVFLLAAGQIAQKYAARQIQTGETARVLPSIFGAYQFWVAAVLMASALVTWLLTLATAEVSKTYPLLASSFIITAIASRLMLGEAIGRIRWIGIAFITVGASLMLGWA